MSGETETVHCVRCREPRLPAGNMVDYQPVNQTNGNLIGICPHCEIMIYQRVSLAKLEIIRGELDITMPQALQHINESKQPSVNSDLK